MPEAISEPAAVVPDDASQSEPQPEQQSTWKSLIWRCGYDLLNFKFIKLIKIPFKRWQGGVWWLQVYKLHILDVLLMNCFHSVLLYKYIGLIRYPTGL